MRLRTTIKFAVILYSIGIVALAQAEPRADPPDIVQDAFEYSSKLEDGVFRSWLPLAGYNPTYSFFFGGGYFFRKVEDGKLARSFSINGISTLHKVVKVESPLTLRLSQRWFFELQNEIGRGFEPNYGRGGETRAEDRVDVPLWKDELNISFPYWMNVHFSIAPVVRYKIRRNRAPDAKGIVERDPMAPEEQSFGIGFIQQSDFRNIPASPEIGWYQAFRGTLVKPFEPNQKQNLFTVLDSELRVFHYLGRRDFVFASSIAGGVIFGTPTYLYEHRLGGTDRLRGFYYDRFRGDKYYVQQNELRFPLYKVVSAAVFFELGEVTQSKFSRAQLSYGGGLRIGLPPDGIEKVRIDYAVSFDQKGLLIDFGHAF